MWPSSTTYLNLTAASFVEADPNILGGRAGILQLTSAIGELANHDLWQKGVSL